MNEAFLDRFAFTYEQDYADPRVETKILTKYAASLGIDDSKFIDNLVAWADLIRKSFKQNIVNEIVTTRRLIDCVTAFAVFGDRLKAVELVVARFDDANRKSFTNLYTKFDASATAEAAAPATAEIKAPY
jgi:MoxR-like ATPase